VQTRCGGWGVHSQEWLCYQRRCELRCGLGPAILRMGSLEYARSFSLLRRRSWSLTVILHRLKPVLLKTVRIKVWPLCPLGRPFYAWDRISGAGVGALIFTAPSTVLESYRLLHRLKPVLLKTVRIKVWPSWPLGRPFYAWDRISAAGVGALIFTARSAVLKSYLILHSQEWLCYQKRSVLRRPRLQTVYGASGLRRLLV